MLYTCIQIFDVMENRTKHDRRWREAVWDCGGPVSLAAVPSARTVVQRRSGLLVPNNSLSHAFSLCRHLQASSSPVSREKLWQCLDPSNFQKFYKILCHIESLDACIEY
jgi:hypothetical protein